jgi:hypothetical protein
MLLQVILERSEADHERARFAERPQAQIHPVDETFVRNRAQELRDASTEPVEVLFVRERAPPVGLAVLREQEYQVDVRREIELAAAKLAHPEHEERQRRAIRAPWRAVASGELAIGACAGRGDAHIGEQR